jgi:hypothetical protein
MQSLRSTARHARPGIVAAAFAALALTIAFADHTEFAAGAEPSATLDSSSSAQPSASRYLTERVLLVIIDGPRDSETFGDSARTNIPFLSRLARGEGFFSRQVRNMGETETMPGHCALFTGNYEDLRNWAIYRFGVRGSCPRPSYPTLFERLRKERGAPASAAVLHSSKMKIACLAWSDAEGYGEKCGASNECGEWELFGPGYSDDKPTFDRAKLEMQHGDATLLVVHFAGPDNRGHAGDSTGYVAAIRRADAFTGALWRLAQELPAWRGKTTLFVASDHGRHLDGVREGFSGHGHGCKCEGCRVILFAAAGPDFDGTPEEITTRREQVDIAATIAELLGISREGMQGEVMTELFRAPDVTSTN